MTVRNFDEKASQRAAKAQQCCARFSHPGPNNALDPAECHLLHPAVPAAGASVVFGTVPATMLRTLRETRREAWSNVVKRGETW